MYQGIAVSPGLGIGKVVLLEEWSTKVQNREIKNVSEEMKRVRDAIKKFSRDTDVMAERMEKVVGKEEAEILRSHIQLLRDPVIQEQIGSLIKEENCSAEMALDQVLGQMAMFFSERCEEFQKQRVMDFTDIRIRMLGILSGVEAIDVSRLPKGTVLVAKDIVPSTIASIVPKNIAGILTQGGGVASHSAILLRATGIPAVFGVDGICGLVKNGDKVVLDGTRGKVILAPDKKTIKYFTKMWHQYETEQKLLQKENVSGEFRKNGKQIKLMCNINRLEEIGSEYVIGSDGIGLFRTEFLFMNRATAPSQEEQLEAYGSVVRAMKGKPVIIRTVDIGGDKQVTYFGMQKEDNPLLGLRGIRFCLAETDLYKTQLRALLRAGVFGDIRIMVPLVTGLEELRQVKAIINDLMEQLKKEGVAYAAPKKLGVMLETPAACIMAEELAKEADFFCIGTNDLTGYLVAADRNNASVNSLCSTYHPAVLRAIAHIIRCGKKEGIEVGICGEASEDPKLAPLFLAYGADRFSVSERNLLRIRNIIDGCDEKECELLAGQVARCVTETEVREVLEDFTA